MWQKSDFRHLIRITRQSICISSSVGAARWIWNSGKGSSATIEYISMVFLRRGWIIKIIGRTNQNYSARDQPRTLEFSEVGLNLAKTVSRLEFNCYYNEISKYRSDAIAMIHSSPEKWLQLALLWVAVAVTDWEEKRLNTMREKGGQPIHPERGDAHP